MSSGIPETGVWNVFLYFPQYHVRVWVEYRTQLLSLHRDFHLYPRIYQLIVWLISSLLVILDDRCILPEKQMYLTIIIGEMGFCCTLLDWRTCAVFSVKRRFVYWRVPEMNLKRLLQVWPVVELSQTKNIEPLSKGTWILSFSASASKKLVVKLWR